MVLNPIEKEFSMLRKLLRIFAFTFSISFVLVLAYLILPQYYTPLENRTKDIFFTFRDSVEPKQNIYIIDIDEKSLDHFGQYPWERTVIADILQKMTEAGAGIIGLDVMFPEEDRTSPHKFAEKFGMDGSSFSNYDEVFAETIANTPTILGYTFDLNAENFVLRDVPMIPATFIEDGWTEENDFIIEAGDIILNIPTIQEASYSSGFFNNTPDQSGIIRAVPLLIKYDDEIFPSLALEMFRIVKQAETVTVHYNPNGVAGISVGDSFIPTDRYGRLTLNFRGPGHTFKYISVLDIYNGDYNRTEMEGAIALIGTSASGLLDIRATPLDSVYPGVETHATAIDNLLSGDFLYKPSWVEGADVVIIFGLVLLLTVLFNTISANYVLMLLPVILVGTFYGIYYTMFGDGVMISALFPFLSILVTTIILMIVNLFFEQSQKKLIKGKFAAKVSPAVMEDLIKNADKDVMVGHEREITVMFSDVRNFTNISESMPNAKTLIEFLNEYMDPMTEIIIKTGGTVDKFIGDAIMAYWNAPTDVDNHPDKAVEATLQQLHACIPLNKRIKEDPRFENTCKMAEGMGKEPIEIGIGLNVGVAVVGEMGSKGRSDYTVIGDPINLGARLESLCKHYNSKCNISNFVKDRLDQDKYIFRFLDLVTVKGKTEPIEIWQIHDFNRGLNGSGNYLFDVSRERIDEELNRYHEGIKLYKEAKFSEALEIFRELQNWKDKTNENVYQMYIERCEHYIEEPPVDFDGVFKHTTKG
jgi:adenylate cyclase